MNVADPRALRELRRRHDIRAATSLGHRLLVDRAAPLLVSLLAEARRPSRVVVPRQQEVARRGAATPRDARERGYLSVFVQSFAEPRIVRRVPARACRPAPRGDSAIAARRTRPQ